MSILTLALFISVLLSLSAVALSSRDDDGLFGA
jgi:hypothetical protein